MALLPRFTKDPADAAAALRAEALVALPTETVYGLGGLASSPTAVARIFQVKRRPTTHPVIVHIADDSAIEHWARDIPPTARLLAEAFWPGPLTIVVPRAPHVSEALTGGQSTVALRAPSHPLFRAVLAKLTTSELPAPGIAAPSANRFGRVSPTTANHVADELENYLDPDDLIVDGGDCAIGIESTIVICRDHDVVVARAGGITIEALATVVTVETQSGGDAEPRVPGSLASHYSPNAQVAMVTNGAEFARVQSALALNPDVGVICLANDIHVVPTSWIRLAVPGTVDQYAQQLYTALRDADRRGLTHVIALAPPADGVGVAIRDRLRRASARMF